MNGDDAEADQKKDELGTFLNLGKSSYALKSKRSSISDWIRVLDWKIIEIVDSVCDSVYEHFGYSKIEYQTWLNNNKRHSA